MPDKRQTIFITHAAPQDNEFALWLASKLALAGYYVWVDRKRLRGGDDSWDEIDRVLRTEAVKQIVVLTENIAKPGVKKELAIGDVVRGRLADPHFMIGIRNANLEYADAPPELLRGNILNGYPNWHDCLKDLFETLEGAGVPRASTTDADVIRSIVTAREDGRRFVVDTPEAALSNWFPITPPEFVRYFRFEGLQDQIRAWRKDCKLPHVEMGRLAGTFCDHPAFSTSSSFDQTLTPSYEIPFIEFISGNDIGPYLDRSSANRDIVNLLRQHFDKVAAARGLMPVAFSNGETGWFFPEGLAQNNKVICVTQDGRRVRRSVTGKFKKLKWHLCLIAKPRIWPSLVYRIHVNVILSEDGKEPLPGDKTHRRRIRLTKSWWNDVWRDRLLAGMAFLADGNSSIAVPTGHENFSIALWPLTANIPVSYEASDPPLPSEEDDEGNIVPSAALEDQLDEIDDALDEIEPDASAGGHAQ